MQWNTEYTDYLRITFKREELLETKVRVIKIDAEGSTWYGKERTRGEKFEDGEKSEHEHQDEAEETNKVAMHDAMVNRSLSIPLVGGGPEDDE